MKWLIIYFIPLVPLLVIAFSIYKFKRASEIFSIKTKAGLVNFVICSIIPFVNFIFLLVTIFVGLIGLTYEIQNNFKLDTLLHKD